MLRNTLSYKFSVFMGAFCILGTIAFFTIQEFVNGQMQGILLFIILGLILTSDIILFILGIIDFFNRKNLKPAAQINRAKLTCEIPSIIIYLLISGILLLMTLSIIFYKP